MADRRRGSRSGEAVEYQGRPIDYWLDQLRREDPACHRKAIIAVGAIGQAAEPAIPCLIALLKEKDIGFRPKVVEALGKIGPARGAVPALLDALKDKEEGVRIAAAVAFARLSEDGYLYHIWELAQVGTRAPNGFADWDSIAQALLDAARDEVDEVRTSAIESLSNSGVGPSAIPVLIEALSDSNESVHRAAEWALTRIDYRSGTSVPALIKLLESPDAVVKEVVINLLNELGPIAMSPFSGDLYEHLLQLRRGGVESGGAANKIGDEADHSPPSIFDSLGQMLLAPDEENRKLSAYLLGSIGAGKRDVEEILSEGKSSPDEGMYVLYETIYESFKILSSSAISGLVQGLEDRDRGVREAVAAALGEFGAGASVAVPSLLKVLAVSGGGERQEVIRVLGRIGPQAVKAVPHLVSALRDPDPKIRLQASISLGRIAPVDETAVRELIVVLGDADAGVRKGAARALAAIDPKIATIEVARAVDREKLISVPPEPASNAESPQTSSWYTVSEAAQLLGKSPSQVSRDCDKEKLTSVGKRKARRIDPKSVVQALKNRGVEESREETAAEVAAKLRQQNSKDQASRPPEKSKRG